MLFFTYLRLELRHRLRQAVFIAAGLAVGIALVITVSAVAAGTSDAQAGVLHGLYGIGTDMTVTRPYATGDAGPGHQVNPGEHLDYLDTNQGLFGAPAAAAIAGLPSVRAAVGVLAMQWTYTPPGGHVPVTPSNPYGLPLSIPVDGVDPASQQLGPLSEARVISGRGLNASDASSDVALVDSGYAAAHHLHAGLGHHAGPPRLPGRRDRQPACRNRTGPAHPDPRRAGPVRLPRRDHNGGRGRRECRRPRHRDRQGQGAIAVGRRDHPATLASEISGSLGETAHLARDLGRWLAVAVLAAAFVLAALLTVAAVSRRVREFGTLKALGWPAGRITAQVLGESVTVGIAGALAGTGLGYAAAAVISRWRGT